MSEPECQKEGGLAVVYAASMCLIKVIELHLGRNECDSNEALEDPSDGQKVRSCGQLSRNGTDAPAYSCNKYITDSLQTLWVRCLANHCIQLN